MKEMDTLLILINNNKDGTPETYMEEITIFCPLCNYKVDDCDFENDDYVTPNCLMNCPKHREIFICPEGYHVEDSEFNNMSNGIVKNSCSKLLNNEELEKYVKEKNISIDFMSESDREYYYFYKVGVLHITAVNDDDEKWNDYIDDPSTVDFHERDCYCGEDLQLSDRNNFFFYRGSCSVCQKNYEGHRWGD